MASRMPVRSKAKRILRRKISGVPTRLRRVHAAPQDGGWLNAVRTLWERLVILSVAPIVLVSAFAGALPASQTRTCQSLEQDLEKER